MKHDQSLRILGEKVICVPYRKEHVPKYHEWMNNEEILRLTGSERLTLEEEFQMQKCWEDDANKCTFIILNRARYENTNDEVESMVGDTNLFLNLPNCDDDEDTEEKHSAEIEIMIAETSVRRQGFAKEALKIMMNFGQERLSLQRYIAKIKDDNFSSIRLFEMLGYKLTGKSDAFNEVSYTLKLC